MMETCLKNFRNILAVPAILLSIGAQAQVADTSGDLEYVAEYGAMIAPGDRVSSTGAKLSAPAAILQQDRFNVHVGGALQPGDSTDSYFGDKAHRAEIAKATIEFSDDQARANVVSGNQPLFVTVMRKKGDDRLMFFVATSDGEPADDSDAGPGPTDRAAPSAPLPAPFHGSWAASTEACATHATLENLTIDARGVHQAEGEMLATRLTLDSANPRKIKVEMQNSGGGEDWASTEEFILSPDGQSIAWRQLKPEAGHVIQLLRCDRG